MNYANLRGYFLWHWVTTEAIRLETVAAHALTWKTRAEKAEKRFRLLTAMVPRYYVEVFEMAETCMEKPDPRHEQIGQEWR